MIASLRIGDSNSRALFSRSTPLFPAPLALIFALIAVLAGWSFLLERREQSITGEVGQLEQEIAPLRRHLADAVLIQPQLQGMLDKARRVMERGTDNSWMPALRNIAISTGPDTELRTIRIWNDLNGTPGRVLRLEGVATGVAPRLNADRFFQAFQREQNQSFPGIEPGRLEQLEDRPLDPESKTKYRSATFTITTPLPPVADPR